MIIECWNSANRQSPMVHFLVALFRYPKGLHIHPPCSNQVWPSLCRKKGNFRPAHQRSSSRMKKGQLKQCVR